MVLVGYRWLKMGKLNDYQYFTEQKPKAVAMYDDHRDLTETKMMRPYTQPEFHQYPQYQYEYGGDQYGEKVLPVGGMGVSLLNIKF